MIDELAISREFVVDMRVKLCYTKDQGCEKDIVALNGLRLPKRLCPLGIGQLPVPGKLSRFAQVMLIYENLRAYKNIRVHKSDL